MLIYTHTHRTSSRLNIPFFSTPCLVTVHHLLMFTERQLFCIPHVSTHILENKEQLKSRQKCGQQFSVMSFHCPKKILHSSGSSSLSWGLWLRLCTSVLIVPCFVCVCVCVYRFAWRGSGPCCWGSSKYFDLKTFLSSLTEVVVIGNWKESTRESLRFEEKHSKSCRNTTSVCRWFCRADYGFTTSLISW